MVPVPLIEQEIFGDRFGRLVRFPTAVVERPKGIAGRIHLAPLPVAFAVLMLILVEELRNELELTLKECVVDCESTRPCRRKGHYRQPLVVTCEALRPLFHRAARAGLEKWQRLRNCCPDCRLVSHRAFDR